MVAQRTLFNLKEELELVSWLTGEMVSSESLIPAHYEQALTNLIVQFSSNFNDVRLDAAKEDLDYMMTNEANPKFRKTLIRGWLNHMAARTKMDGKAYYIVKKHRCKK